MTLLPHPVTGTPYLSPVPPGTGWPDDAASADTPVARTPAAVRRLAATDDLAELDARVSVCSACPRLVRWREDVARDKRASFADQPYWGRPIAGWGDPTTGLGDEARLVIVGLAPAANGGNRTGRVFTGDSSGDWLFASLHRVGLATQATSEHAGDGQRLVDARMVATVRCAPPANKPTVAERDTCMPWINRELALLAPTMRVVVALGAYGWDGALRALAGSGLRRPETAPPIRPRRLGRPDARRPRGDAARLLPPVAAQHVHRPTDPGDARRPLHHRPRPRRHPGPLTPATMRDVIRREPSRARNA
jgi:uracil-DNA glycosylase family 4